MWMVTVQLWMDERMDHALNTGDLTCDEIAQFSVQACIVIGADETSYNVVSGDVLLQGNIVHARVEGGRLIIYIQD